MPSIATINTRGSVKLSIAIKALKAYFSTKNLYYSDDAYYVVFERAQTASLLISLSSN